MNLDQKPKAFVLMPFAPEFTSIYSDLIKPALEDAGYEVVRADSFLDQQNILRDIVHGIATAHLIVAELTTLNANVMYELGLSHGLRMPTIMLTQSTGELPFDLRSYRVLAYSTRFDQVHKLKQVLKEIAEKHKNQGITFGSPVVKETGQIISDTAENKLQVDQDEKGFLDFLVEGNQAAEEMAIVMDEIRDGTLHIGNRMSEHTESIKKISSNPGPGSALQAHKIALIVAQEMIAYSTKIDGRLPSFEKNADTLIESFSGYVSFIKLNTESSRLQIAKFRGNIVAILEATGHALKGIRSYRDAITLLKNTGVSKELSRASRQVTQTLENLISTMEKIEAFCVRTLGLMDEQLGSINNEA
jgi:uncharacterized protein YukE